MIEHLSVAIAVVEQAGCFLVGKRTQDRPLGGLWEFPGGKIEGDESPRVAAARECWEEAGVRVRVTHRLLIHRQQYPHAEITLHFFACQLIEPESPLRPPFAWVARADLGNLEFPAGNRPLLQQLLR